MDSLLIGNGRFSAVPIGTSPCSAPPFSFWISLSDQTPASLLLDSYFFYFPTSLYYSVSPEV